MKKFITVLKIFTVSVLIAVFTVLTINLYTVLSVKDRIIDRDTAAEITDADYIVVLGCGIKGNRPTHMLEDRLLEGLAVAQKNKNAMLLLTGDNSGEHYNEVAVMKSFCIEKGFDENRIATDDFGFSTGESMENVKSTFNGKKIIIITQKYHTYRALFIAEKTGLEAYAVPSDPRRYSTWLYNSTREPLARVKDFIKYSFI